MSFSAKSTERLAWQTEHNRPQGSRAGLEAFFLTTDVAVEVLFKELIKLRLFGMPGPVLPWRFGHEAAAGILVPDKSTVYPEHLPPSVTRVHPQSRLEQLLEYLSKHSDVPVVDLRRAMLAAKRQRSVYYRTDTHWNGWGEYVAYREIMEAPARHFPELGPRPQSSFRPEIRPAEFSGDMAGMAGLQPLLSEHFRRAVYVRSLKFSQQVLDQEKPDIVVHQMVERSLMDGPPKRTLDD